MAALPSASPRLPLPPRTPTWTAPANWQAIDFLSDLHLSAATPRAFAAWSSHLERTTADAVVMLGDLFEAWVGDDMASTGFERACAGVLESAARRRRLAFMAGNRDFLVGEGWLRARGVVPLHDPTTIEAWGVRVVATHGDLLCLDDVGYQRYRRLVRQPALQRAFLALPLPWRRRVGRALRARGDRAQATPSRPTPHAAPASPHDARSVTPPTALEVDRASTAAWLDAAGATTLVHGHTHAAGDHDLDGLRRRLVLSDWSLDGDRPPRADVLRWTANGFARIAPARD